MTTPSDDTPWPTPEPARSAERHERVKQLFVAALNVPRARRAAFLAEACGGDDSVRREVLELFLLHGEQDSVLDAPLDASDALEQLGAPARGQIGPWHLVRELGRGGMGVVFLAECDGSAAAIKVLGAGAISSEGRERFRLETEILRRLDHPGIARVLDSGEHTGPGGVPQPWIAMEYVEGHRLLDHAVQAALELRARIELLAAVCDAVQHAHAHGIVHRDLKPSNIMVRPNGRPVVLDFGVARLTSGDERPTELATRTGQLVGTPQYMSPEQVQGEPSAITPASDVYSLGIIAYELLSGQVPYQAASSSLHRAVVTILTVEPPPLGRAVPALRGPLERVVGKALEKSPELRYADAGELAVDLRRWLGGRTVSARGPSLLRRAQRWSRGRRRLLAATSLALVAAMLVTAWVLGGARRVPHQQVLANYREAEGLMIQAMPLVYEGERTPERMRQAIDRYLRARTLIEAVPQLPHHDPLLRRLESELGTAQFLLGELTWDTAPTRAAMATLEHALSLRADTLPSMRGMVQVPQLTHLYTSRADLLGILTATTLARQRQWGESSASTAAVDQALECMAENIRVHGPVRPLAELSAEERDHDVFGYSYNSLAETATDRARFTNEAADAKRAAAWSDSAVARLVTFRDNWPALGSVLFERGRAYRTLGTLTRSRAALDTSERYLAACKDLRGSERPWVYAETAMELARLAVDRLRQEGASGPAIQRLELAHAELDRAVHVVRGSAMVPITAAVLQVADAEVLAEMAMALRRPQLADSAEARLEQALPLLPMTSVPREAGLGWLSRAVLDRARFQLTGSGSEPAQQALERARSIFDAKSDSLLLHAIEAERERLDRSLGARGISTERR